LPLLHLCSSHFKFNLPALAPRPSSVWSAALERTLVETAHTLPLYGVGCKFWRAKTEDCAETKGQYFVADSAEYRLRPIRGMLRGTQYYFGRRVLTGVAPVAKSLGSWRRLPLSRACPATVGPG
ncbi:unnamed protein product, partial [Prorocentrum cordatum]